MLSLEKYRAEDCYGQTVGKEGLARLPELDKLSLKRFKTRCDGADRTL
jgi:hypothetical protein